MVADRALAAGDGVVDRGVEDHRLAVRAADHQGAGAAAVEVHGALCSGINQDLGEFVQADAAAVARLAAVDNHDDQFVASLVDPDGGAGVADAGAEVGDDGAAVDQKLRAADHIFSAANDPANVYGPAAAEDQHGGFFIGRLGVSYSVGAGVTVGGHGVTGVGVVEGTARPPGLEPAAVDRQLQLEFLKELGGGAGVDGQIGFRLVRGSDQRPDRAAVDFDLNDVDDKGIWEAADLALVGDALIQLLFVGGRLAQDVKAEAAGVESQEQDEEEEEDFKYISHSHISMCEVKPAHFTAEFGVGTGFEILRRSRNLWCNPMKDFKFVRILIQFGTGDGSSAADDVCGYSVIEHTLKNLVIQ